MKQFVLFSLNAHVLPFVRTELQVLDALGQQDRVQLIVLKASRCTCEVEKSINMAAAGMKAECARCRVEQRFVEATSPNVKIELLDDYVDSADEAIAESMTAAASFDELRDITLEGVSIGKMALYDIILKYKVNQLESLASGEPFLDYKALVRAGVLVLLRFQRFLQSRPVTGVLTYNSNYTINNIVTGYCLREKVPVFSMHGGISHRRVWETLILTEGRIGTFWANCAQNWNRGFSDRTLSADEAALVGEHFSELFNAQASHVYSAALNSASCKPLIDAASDGGRRKVLLVATSSADEFFASEEAGVRTYPRDEFLFDSQIEWIEFLISRVRHRDDIAMIVRVHPREFPNKRDGVTSMHARHLAEVLESVPSNVFINWPSDNISLYQMVVATDMTLSCWSSALLEASAFGSPIVLPRNPINIYDSVADVNASTCDEYWEQVSRFLFEDWSIERVIRTFRWIWFLQFGGVISLSSDEVRTGTLRERLQEIPAIIKHRVGRGFIKRPTVRDAFHGEYRKLSQREINFKGGNVLREIFFKDASISRDFFAIRRLQGERDGVSECVVSADEERMAIIRELMRIKETLDAVASISSTSKFARLADSLGC